MVDSIASPEAGAAPGVLAVPPHPEPAAPVGAFDVVVVAASLGGPEVLREVIAGLPRWFPAAILIVQHRTPAAQDLTVELLRRRTELEVGLARVGDRPRRYAVQVMPADTQIVLGEDGAFARQAQPAGRSCAADPLIVSVAERFGPRAIGVVLSGRSDDGAAGAAALKRAGGRVLAQDRASARCFSMPAAAIATGCVDLVLPAERIAPALISLVLWPGAAELLRVPLPHWATLDHGRGGAPAHQR